ncbi:hypothetical protein PLICBS_010159 [Purpureocillium lilacinum]|uniref:uncharacterized protein n=1 Tax=Purpureocillium lilacinum TaxID=33203 RepID=UPI0020887446|nr:hypothetical protein PLICBS_010159 [Purpureocillium lilacinum]
MQSTDAGATTPSIQAKYAHYLPTWNPKHKYPPLEPFEHHDHGKDADPSFPNLLPFETTTTHLTPTIGTEIKGVQLSSLSDAGKDELALFVARRKVVVFRDQDFADLSIADALLYGSYFGRLHIHPTSGSPEGHPEIRVVYRGEGNGGRESILRARTNTLSWHSDVSYEEQPPGTTILFVLSKPDTGGDTLFVDAAEAYRRLSTPFQERLHGLKGRHSGIEKVNDEAIAAGIMRRAPVVNDHPLVRTHPATGEKALFVNPLGKFYSTLVTYSFSYINAGRIVTREIIGMKAEESDAILKFLFDHLAYGADFQARIKWEDRTVVIWDNRMTLHTALLDWESGQVRHLARITAQAERPYETPFAT